MPDVLLNLCVVGAERLTLARDTDIDNKGSTVAPQRSRTAAPQHQQTVLWHHHEAGAKLQTDSVLPPALTINVQDRRQVAALVTGHRTCHTVLAKVTGQSAIALAQVPPEITAQGTGNSTGQSTGN